MTRMKAYYRETVAPALFKKFGYKSVMQVPKLDKIIINVGCGEAKENAKIVDSIINQQITQNLKQVDSFIRSNASFQSKSGLSVKVSRYYYDVGLRNRTQKCAWCLERCGVDVPYVDAVRMGMFERHEGCGCKIVYKSERTSYQTKKGAWKHE